MDTIYALATPPGRGGIAVVRVSGPQAAEGLKKLTGKLPSPRQAKLCQIKNPASGASVDRGIVLFFGAPASYTGDDLVEYQIHGGRAVVESLLSALAACPGHRLAGPGEFTRRAFENGRIDLTAAEAVADLIAAETEAQKAQALEQMGGALAALYEDWAARLTRALAHLEADIDFPDDDLPGGVARQVQPELEDLLGRIGGHLNDNRRGERLRDGIQVAVIGAPNAGKSSLVNALAQRDVAIVSEQAGTTRDVIEVHLDLGGYPVIVADTAGLRPDQLGATGHDAIESEGIRRAVKKAREADIRILLFDAAAEPDSHTLALAGEDSLIAINKIDQRPQGPGDLLSKGQKEILRFAKDGAIFMSVRTGAGVDVLLDRLVAKIKAIVGDRAAPSLTRRRHRDALEECRESLQRALDGNQPELVAEDVRLAIRALGRVTGRVDVEDLLDVIFRDFCIGK